jgi:excinuclease ABC subunit A
MLQEVGLGYIKVGQSATTLSGGEAQRVKLSKELSRRATGKTLYILDEPTTGLHFEDVRKLLEVLHRLADQGNTVVVIEHNLDVIKTADWVIDLGPGGGVNGGRIIAEGVPETIAKEPLSATGQYLKPMLERASVKPTVVETKPKKPARSRRVSFEEDEPDLIAAK